MQRENRGLRNYESGRKSVLGDCDLAHCRQHTEPLKAGQLLSDQIPAQTYAERSRTRRGWRRYQFRGETSRIDGAERPRSCQLKSFVYFPKYTNESEVPDWGRQIQVPAGVE